MSHVTEFVLNEPHLTHHKMPPIEQQLDLLAEQAGQGTLRLDFSRVEFLTSMVLAKLITLNKRMKNAGGSLQIVNLNAEVYELFVITRLHTVLHVHAKPALDAESAGSSSGSGLGPVPERLGGNREAMVPEARSLPRGDAPPCPWLHPGRSRRVATCLAPLDVMKTPSFLPQAPREPVRRSIRRSSSIPLSSVAHSAASFALDRFAV